MSENKIILITDEYTRDSYLYHFIKSQQSCMREVCILHVHLGSWSNFSISMNTAAELHLPLIWKGVPTKTMKEKLGHRAIDFLILNGVIDYESNVTFIFNNANLHFMAEIMKARIKKSRVIVYVDALNWEQREDENYAMNASLYRSATGDETKLKPLRNKEERSFFEKADVLWCYNDACRSFIENIYGIKASLWPYITEDDEIPLLSPEMRMAARKRLSLFPEEMVVFFYYDGVSEEAFHLLTDALNRPSFRLLITGQPVLSDKRLSCRTSFLGDVETFLPFIQIADMVVLLSEREIKNTFPQLCLRMNIPVISSPLAMAADLVTPDVHILSEKTADYIRELAGEETDEELTISVVMPARKMDQFLQQLALV